MKRALTLVAVIAIVCIVLLLLMLRKLEDYRSPPAPPPTTAPPDAGAAVAGEGRVLFSDGVPAPGATVTFGPREADESGQAAGTGAGEAATGADGAYSLGSAAGRGGFVSARLGPLQARAAGPADPAAPAPTLSLPATFRLAGRVQTRAGAVVEGARVTCAGVETRSGPRGSFALDEVPAAALRDVRLSVIVEADGHERLVWEVPRDELPPYYGDLTLLLAPIP